MTTYPNREIFVPPFTPSVERLQAVRRWLPPQLRILWREQHRDAAYQLALPRRSTRALIPPAGPLFSVLASTIQTTEKYLGGEQEHCERGERSHLCAS